LGPVDSLTHDPVKVTKNLPWGGNYMAVKKKATKKAAKKKPAKKTTKKAAKKKPAKKKKK
jgi:hypothetical protein